MNQQTLDLIGRKHTVEQIKNVYSMAREEGFNNINMDIILGLVGEDVDEVAHTPCWKLLHHRQLLSVFPP